MGGGRGIFLFISRPLQPKTNIEHTRLKRQGHRSFQKEKNMLLPYIYIRKCRRIITFLKKQLYYNIEKNYKKEEKRNTVEFYEQGFGIIFITFENMVKSSRVSKVWWGLFYLFRPTFLPEYQQQRPRQPPRAKQQPVYISGNSPSLINKHFWTPCTKGYR